jgi:hypothetical protein
MMSLPATPSSADHPYRAPFEPLDFDPEGGRVPYSGQRRMQLTIASGLAGARIVIDPAARDLLTIEPTSRSRLRPYLELTNDELRLTWRTSLGGWLCGVLSAGDVFTAGLRVAAAPQELILVLHPAVAWTLLLRGGVANVECAFAAGSLDGVDIAGGCSQLRLDLPAPTTSVPIRISGGASGLGLRRPAAAGVALAVEGGIAGLRLDDRRFAAIGGAAQLETRVLDEGAPRYELAIRGGACDLAVERR